MKLKISSLFGSSIFVGNSEDTSIRVVDGNMSNIRLSGVVCSTDVPDNISEIIFGNLVTGIGEEAFYERRALNRVVLSSTTTEIQPWAFYGTGISSIHIPGSVREIGKGVFGDIDIDLFSVESTNPNWKSESRMLLSRDGKTLAGGVNGEMAVPDGVQTIDYWSCSGRRRLTSVSIPSTVTKILDGAFRGCASLTSVTIPDSVVELGKWAFEDCTSLKSATIGNGIDILNYGMFAGCTNLTTVDLGGTVHYIDSFAFGQCSSLTSITIPGQVFGIGENAFADCTNLMTINMPDFTMQEVTDGGYLTWGFASGATIVCSDGNLVVS